MEIVRTKESLTTKTTLGYQINLCRDYSEPDFETKISNVREEEEQEARGG